MNFDDTPQEAAFRAEAKAWISANAPKQYEDELKKSSLGRSGLKGANMLDVDPGHDLVAVVRRIDPEAVGGCLGRLLAAVDRG